MPIPELPKVASPQHEDPEDEEDEEEGNQIPLPIRRSMAEERPGAPPVPRGKRSDTDMDAVITFQKSS
jgi:hypothetical protein